MPCHCRERIQNILKRYQYEAQLQNRDYTRQIERFQNGIRSAAEEVATIHLFRAGVYWASYDNACARDPDVSSILRSASEYVRRDYPDLNCLVRNLTNMVSEWGVPEEPVQLLRSILRNRSEKTLPLLLANAKNEVEASREALKSANTVSKQLNMWREGVIVQTSPEVICIADMHDESITPSG